MCLLLRAVAEELLKGQNTNEFCSIKSAALNQATLRQHKPRCGQGQALLGEKGLFTHEAPTFSQLPNSDNIAKLGHRDGEIRLYIN